MTRSLQFNTNAQNGRTFPRFRFFSDIALCSCYVRHLIIAEGAVEDVEHRQIVDAQI